MTEAEVRKIKKLEDSSRLNLKREEVASSPVLQVALEAGKG